MLAGCSTNEIVVNKDTNRPLFFVAEDRNWARDALTNERVIAMPAFRRLCPEQLLRPGDDVAIGRVALSAGTCGTCDPTGADRVEPQNAGTGNPRSQRRSSALVLIEFDPRKTALIVNRHGRLIPRPCGRLTVSGGNRSDEALGGDAAARVRKCPTCRSLAVARSD